MMGRGFLKRAARMKASSWVLSPISASATTPVETARGPVRDSMKGMWGTQAGTRTDDHGAPPGQDGRNVVKGLARPTGWARKLLTPWSADQVC